ncbi:MAG TPA: TIR domain-containing protein [Nitrospira sp.]|nr:TIR domain-containing protein [Nitrospira sp.]
MSDSFISYASEDKSRVQALARALGQKGWSVWWDRRIPVGRSYAEVIEEALDASKAVVVVWTTTSVKSQWVKNEALEGLNRRVLFPVMLEAVKIPLEFRHVQAARLMDWQPEKEHAGFEQFIHDLTGVIGAPVMRSQTSPASSGKPRFKPELEPLSTSVSEVEYEIERLDSTPSSITIGAVNLDSPRGSFFLRDAMEVGQESGQSGKARPNQLAGKDSSTQFLPYLLISIGVLAVIGVLAYLVVFSQGSSPRNIEEETYRPALRSPSPPTEVTPSPPVPEPIQKESPQHWEVQSVDKSSSLLSQQGTQLVTPRSLESVTGRGCYTYGDNETVTQSTQAAQNIAQKDALQSHGVFVQSVSKVKNFQLADNVVQVASAGLLEQVRVEKVEKKTGQLICVSISAKLNPFSLEEMIRQQINAEEAANESTKLKVPSAVPGFGIQVWTNKTDGRFFEGERLIIYVKAERDGYLKLDYFQADGTVVHLVPNHSRAQAVIKAGQTYVFGGDDSAEKIVIQPPYGKEIVKAMLSAQSFEFPNIYKPALLSG